MPTAMEAEMAYCMSAVRMLLEEFWQIVECFAEVSTNLHAEIIICGRNVPDNESSNISKLLGKEYCTPATEKLSLRAVIFFLPKNPFLRGNILREPTDGVPANKFLFAGTVPANKFLFTGTVPANKF